MTPQYNDNIYNLLGTFGFTGAFNDRWKGYLNSFGLAGTNNDMLYSFLGQLGYLGSLTDRWNSYLDSVGGSFVGFAKLYLNFADGTNLLDSRINFTRTTNATVTNSAGLITYAPHNLLTYSEQFDNAAWVKSGTTVTANNIISPDNTITADKIVETATTARHFIYPSNYSFVFGTTYAISFYAKQAERSLIQLSFGSSLSLSYANIDLSTGTQTAGTSDFVTITLNNNGFYKITCLITALSTISTNPFSIDIITNSTVGRGVSSYAGDGTSGVYLWGAQLEIGSTATTYNSTTVKNLLGFSELFDNAAWTKSNSFVQTNLFTYSEDLSNAIWFKTRASATSNVITAPNGYLTADKLIENTTVGNTHIVTQNYITSALTYTYSVYAKAGERTWIRLDNSSVTNATAFFNLTTGVVGTVGVAASASIESVGNGWYRCSVTATATAASNAFRAALSPDGVTVIYTGDGTSGAYLWGAQLVQGSVAGDYRRTDAAALPVYYPNHNGVVCAEKLVEDTANSNHRFFVGFTPSGANTPYTYSIYAKAGERTRFQLAVGGGGFNSTGTNFNLATGLATDGTYSITPVGDGWYRCSILVTSLAASAGLIYLYIQNDSGLNTYTGDGTSGIYIFGAQLSDSASLDPYVLNAGTAPTAAAYYAPRFDYDPVTLAPKGLLIEEQRANLCVFSGDTSNANWAGTNVTKTSTNNLAPDGSSTALLATASGGSASHTIGASVTATVSYTLGTTYTISCFVKEGSTNRIQLSGTGTGFGASQYANFLLSGSGSVTAVAGGTATIQQFSNSYYRITLTIPATATAAGSAGVLAFITSGTDTRFPTNASTDNIYMWGFQTEAGAFATSYIPTAASQVTRAADVARIQGSNFYSWYNQNEGSVFANAVSYGSSGGGSSVFWSVSDATLNNRMRFSSTGGVYDGSTNGTSQFSIVQTYAYGSYAKVASAYKINSFSSAINNTLGTEDTSGTTAIVNQMQIGNLLTTRDLSGHIKQLSYYPQRLSNDVLKGLTA